jgi:DNA polymerase-3 subunit delta'
MVDAADDLQVEAAHAVLKTLEEPPPSVLLLLLATDIDALLPTLRSRCQELVLRPSPVASLAEALVESGIEPQRADELARLAHGRYGIAQRLHADPSIVVLRETVAADIARLTESGRNVRLDYAEMLAGRWSKERDAVIATLDIWREWWRDALLVASGVQQAVDAAAPMFTPAETLRALQAVQRTREHLLQNTNPQLAVEVMMLDLPRRTGKETREPATSAT